MRQIDIEESYCRAIQDDSYKDFKDNMKLFEGKASIVFLDSVMKRIKLAYKGLCTGDYFINGYDPVTKRYTGYTNDEFRGVIKDLVINCDMHKVSTDIFTNLALNEGVKWTCNDEYQEMFENYFEENKIENKIRAAIKSVDWSGSVLARRISRENDLDSINFVNLHNYFPVFRNDIPDEVIGCVVYQKITFCSEMNKDIYLFTEYTDNTKKMYLGHITFLSEGCCISAIENPTRYLEKSGISIESLIETTTENRHFEELYTDREDYRAFGSSNYSLGSKNSVREIIVTKTITGQTLDTVLRPTLVVDEGFAERDLENDTMKINFKNDVWIWTEGNTEKPLFEQVKIDFPFEGSNSVIKREELSVYRSLGYNETSTGTSDKGYNSISGKMVDMVAPIQRANNLYKAVTKGLAKLINDIFMESGIDLGLSFQMGSPMTLTQKEKIENASMEIDGQLTSNKEAIANYHDLELTDAEQKYNDILEERRANMPTPVSDLNF